MSEGLLSICRERGFEAVRCNCLSLPFRGGTADGVICIAVIHHLSTKVCTTMQKKSYLAYQSYIILFHFQGAKDPVH